MFSISSVVLSALFALATAQSNIPAAVFSLPPNAQNGAVRFPSRCTILGVNLTLDGVFSATGPVIGGPGQDVYLTETTVNITLPYNELFGLAPMFNITQASSRVFANLTGQNFAQDVISIFPGGLLIPNTTLPFKNGSSINVALPTTPGDVLPPIGPVTLGSQPGNAVAFLGGILILIDLLDKDGNIVFADVEVSCPAPEPDIQLAVNTVAGPAGQPPLMYFSGGAGTFPELADNFEFGTFRLPYTCDFEGFGNTDIDISVSGGVKTFVKPGEEYYLYNSTSYLRVPLSVATQLTNKFPTLSTVRTTASEFFIASTNASPALLNALKSPIVINLQSVGGELVLAVPDSGTLLVGPITAGPTLGTTSFIGTGNATASLDVLDAKNATIGTVGVKCFPTVHIDFIGFPITNSIPGQS